MKKIYKILSCILALSIVISAAVLPVSVNASSTNLVGAITGISGNSTDGYTVTYEAGVSAGATTPVWVEASKTGTVVEHATIAYADGIVSISGRPASGAHVGLAYNKLGVQAGKTYFISGEFRMDTDPGTGNKTARYYFSQTNTGTDLAVKPSAEIGTTALVLNEWKTVSGTFEVGTADDAAGRTENGLHLGFKVGQNSNSASFDYSFRNITVEEVTAFTAEVAGTDATADSAELSVTFSNAPVAFTSANVDVSGGSATVNVSDEGNNVYTISLSALAPETAYTVSLKDVADKFGQTPTGTTSAAVTTTALSSNILEQNSLNFSFENGTTGVKIEDGITAVTSAEASDGSKSLLLTDFEASKNTARFTNVPVTAGKTYRLTVDAKLAAAPASGTTVKMRGVAGYIGAEGSGEVVGDYTTELSASEWKTLAFDFTVATGKTKVHLGPQFSAAFADGIYVDNFTLTEVTQSDDDSDQTGNLLPVIASIEGEAGSYVFKDASGNTLSGWKQNTNDSDACTLSISDGEISVSNRTHSVEGLLYNGAPLVAGKTYIISADIYAESAVSDMAARFYIDGVDDIGLTNLKNGSWVTVKGGFTAIEKTTHSIQFKVGKVAEAASLNYKIKNITLEEAPAFTGAISTTAKDSSSATLTAEFATPVELTTDSIEVSGGAYTVGEVTKANNKAVAGDFAYTIKLSGLEASTNYTVSVKNTVTDDFSQALTGTISASFTTDEAQGGTVTPPAGDSEQTGNLLPVIASIEGTPGSYVFKDASGNTLSGWKQNTNDSDACTLSISDGEISVSNRTHSVEGLLYNGAPLVAGKTYIISADIYAESAVSDMAARFFIDGVDGIGQANLSANTWKTISGTFTAGDSPAGNIQMKVGKVAEASTLNYKVRNISLKLYDPTVLTVDAADFENEILTIEFSSEVPAANFTAENISVNRGAEINEIKHISDTKYRISFNNLIGETEYTVTLTDVHNISTGVIESYLVKFTTDAQSGVSQVGTTVDFESGLSPFSNGGTCASGGNHWSISTADFHSGSSSAYNYGCNCGGQFVWHFDTEPLADYVLTFWAKFDGSFTVIPRAEGARDGVNVTNSNDAITEKKFEGDGTWRQYSLSFNSSITKNGVTYPNNKIYLRLNAPNQPTWLDDVAVYKDLGEMSAVYSVPEAGETSVDVQTDSIKIRFTNPVSSYLSLTNVSDYVTIDNGAQITSLTLADNNYAIVADIDNAKVLEPSTEYTVTVKNVIDVAGQLMEEKSFKFKTEPALVVTSPLTVTESGSTVTNVTATVKNRKASSVEAPAIIYTLYNGASLEAIGSTALEGTMAEFASATLSNTDTVDKTDKAYNAYIISGYSNIALVTAPYVASGSITAENVESKAIVSNAESGTVTVSGKAEGGSIVSIAVIKPQDAARNTQNVANYKNNERTVDISTFFAAPDTQMTASNISSYVHSFVTATADAEGNYSAVISVPLTDTETVYAVIVSGEGFGEAEASSVLMPSATVLTDAKNAINGATSAAQMKAALDTYGAALGFDVASAVYATDGSDIAKAMLACRPAGGFTDFTSGTAGSAMALFDDISEYCALQREALALLNTQTNDAIATTLANYSGVLGYYEDATKLNYQAKYNQYGQYAVNQKLITLRTNNPFTSMSDFITRFNAIVIEQNDNGGGSSYSGGGGVAGAPVTPGIGLPEQAAAEASSMFNDIADVEWAKEAIENLANRGIINGMGDGSFAPNANVTREQFVKMLVESFNIPVAQGSVFDDVDSNAWYAPYVYGAYNAGIINGISDTEFGVGVSISRQDLVTMIYRVMASLNTMPEAVTSMWFEDEASISDYAKEAVQILADAGIINGMSEGIFAPSLSATRAQTAVILDRLFNTYLDVYFY